VSRLDDDDLTIGATEVGMGQGAQAQSVRFTDSDGTVSTLSVRGGSATVRFNGTNITQVLSGRTTVVSGTNVSVGQVVLAGPNPNATVFYGDQTWEEMHFPSYGLVLNDLTLDPRTVIRGPGLGNRGN